MAEAGDFRVTGTVFKPWLEYEITPGVYYLWRRKSDEVEYGISLTLRVVFEGHRNAGQAAPEAAPPPP